jgi:hypothetical protein
MFRAIAVDLESTGATGGKIVAAGIAYCDGEVGALKVTEHGMRRYQFGDFTTPTVDGESVLDKDGNIVNKEGVLEYGSFEPRCWNEFWAKQSASLRCELLCGITSDLNDPSTWANMRDWINVLCSEAVLAGRTPIIVSDNPAFDIGVTDSELRKLVLPVAVNNVHEIHPDDQPPWSLLYIPSKMEDGVVCPPSYSSIRSPNTAWKLREKGIIDYPDIAVEGAEHTHLPENDALFIAANYVSFISKFGME